MQSSPVPARLALMSVALTLGCSSDEPFVERHYPMRSGTYGVEAESWGISSPSASRTPTSAADGETDTDEPPKLRERPKPDSAIAVTLDMISASGRTFIDPADGEDSRPTEYTAEQFASMLRSKWDWIGYDIIELDPWLDEIATRSFKTNLPYLVVLADGSTTEFRPWLDAQRAQAKQP
jgi:hypothetical protein